MSKMSPPSFGKYTVIRLIGQGGFGEVYLARDPNLADKVAIKTIYPHLARERGFERRFLREAKLVRKLNHTNIVRLYAYEVVNGQPFMVMEYLEGGTLKERLTKLRARGQAMSFEEIARLVDAIASALDYAHAQGAIHRDIKPANILYRSRDEPVLTDFGIAKLMEESVRLSKPGETSGTASYMSPEQAEGLPVDARSDVYSLGAVLYELVAGRVPFQGDTPASVLKKHVHDPPPLPKQFNPDISDAMQAVILKALEKSPDARFASTGELARAFNAALRGQAPVEQKEHEETEVETVRESVSEAEPTHREPRPRSNLAGYGIVGCLLLVLCVTVVAGASVFLPSFFSIPSSLAPVAGATRRATPSLPPACPGAEGRLIWFDDFDDPKSGWETTIESNYEAGAFSMSMTTTNTVRSKVIAVADIGVRYRIETHARRISGPNNNEYGLVFAYQDVYNKHYFRVIDEGRFRLAKTIYEDGASKWQYLMPWTETPLVRSGNLNALGVKVEGTRITACLNGQVILTVYDSELRTGKVGFAIGTFDQPIHVRFEDFAVWKLE
jgi:serine/threonine protein kinase